MGKDHVGKLWEKIGHRITQIKGRKHSASSYIGRRGGREPLVVGSCNRTVEESLQRMTEDRGARGWRAIKSQDG